MHIAGDSVVRDKLCARVIQATKLMFGAGVMRVYSMLCAKDSCAEQSIGRMFRAASI